MLWITHMIVFAAGIILGVLFARKNPKKVEKAVSAVEEEYKRRRG